MRDVVRWMKFTYSTAVALAALAFLVTCYVVTFVVMWFPRGPEEEDKPEEEPEEEWESRIRNPRNTEPPTCP